MNPQPLAQGCGHVRGRSTLARCLRKQAHLICSALLIACGFGTRLSAQEKSKAEGKPVPDIASQAYDPHKHNVFDLWKAKSVTPTPLVVFIHGGGFSAGSRTDLSPGLLTGLLAKGISVMAIDCRLTPETFFPGHSTGPPARCRVEPESAALRRDRRVGGRRPPRSTPCCVVCTA